MRKISEINFLIDSGFFSPIDVTFADFICRLEGDDDGMFATIVALVSRAARNKNICLDLSRISADIPEEILEKGILNIPAAVEQKSLLYDKKTVGAPGENTPLILDGNRLYLSRYYSYENSVESCVREWGFRNIECDIESIIPFISELFPGDEGIDWQKCSTVNALTRKLSIITGGPGTGKTTTVVRILLLAAYEFTMRYGRHPSIVLAAPTGKAAAHMQQSVSSALEFLRDARGNSSRIGLLLDMAGNCFPESGTTLHRLIHHARRYGKDGVIPCDMLVIDECSMADIALFSKVLESTGESTRVIILGDKDQLSSVEAGSVLGDLCDQGSIDEKYDMDYAVAMKRYANTELPEALIAKQKRGLSGVVTYLVKSRRFGHESGIGRLAETVNRGMGDEAFQIVSGGEYPDIRWTELGTIPDGADASRKSNIRIIVEEALSGTKGSDGYPLLTADPVRLDDPSALLNAQAQFQFLCAMRKGPYGTESINRIIEDILIKNGRIRKGGQIYHGMPIIVTENDHSLRLYNGDTGVVCARGGVLRVCFNSADGVRSVIPLQISSWEMSYALTVHKSQGSEYDHVVIMLGDRDHRILTRELLYTAITRARKCVHIIGQKESLIKACGRRTERDSGLGEKIWKE
jgi:exodeoxyribonuclease V alpha subunit